MKPSFLAVVAFLGVLAFLVLFLTDREIQGGIERLSHYRFSPRSALDAEPGLILVSGPVRPRAAGPGLAPGKTLALYRRRTAE